MKRFILLALFICLLMSSCKTDNEKDNILMNNIEVSFICECYHNSNGNSDLTIYMSLLSHNTETVTLNIDSLKIIREANSAEYLVNTFFSSNPILLQCDLKKKIELWSTIPTSLAGETYNLHVLFSIGEVKKETIFKMSAPLPKVPEDITISFKVNNEIVHQEIIKEGDSIANLFVYENPNHLTHVSEWYDGDEKITTKTVFTESKEITGKEISNFEWSTGILSNYLKSIKYVPSDGIIIIPEKYSSKITIDINVIRYNDKIKTIYLPDSIIKIYNGNFLNCQNLTTIYYAGTESQWNEITKEKKDGIPEGITVVFEKSEPENQDIDENINNDSQELNSNPNFVEILTEKYGSKVTSSTSSISGISYDVRINNTKFIGYYEDSSSLHWVESFNCPLGKYSSIQISAKYGEFNKANVTFHISFADSSYVTGFTTIDATKEYDELSIDDFRSIINEDKINMEEMLNEFNKNILNVLKDFQSWMKNDIKVELK